MFIGLSITGIVALTVYLIYCLSIINPVQTYQGQGVTPKFSDVVGLNRRLPVTLPAGVNYSQGQILGNVTGSGTAVNDVQTITIGGSPTGGTFQLVCGYLGQTVAIAYNATAATVQAALVTLFGTGNVAVTGSAGGPYTVTFQGQCGGLEQQLMTTYAALTGGTSPTATVAHTTLGNSPNGHMAAYVNGASDGRQTPHFVLQYPCSTDVTGKITNSTVQGVSDWNNFSLTAPAYYGGVFAISDLVGLDANALGIMGYLIAGTGYNDTTNGIVVLF